MMHLTDTDLALWLQAVKAQPAAPDDLHGWVEGPLRRFFPFRSALLVHGELMAGEIKVTHWLNCGHEPRFIQQISTSFELAQRGSLRWWLTHQKPFGIDPISPPAFATASEVDELQTFDMGRIATHGVANVKANAGT